MANTFYRHPIDGSDVGVWSAKALPQWYPSLGIMTCQIYDDAGTLKIGKGFIGIDNGTSKGVIVVDTVTTITLHTNNAEWGIVEVAVSGSTVTFSCTNTGKVAAATLPTDFTTNWDAAKAAYYETATKRALAAAWKNTGGTLEGLCVGKSNQEGYNAYSQSDDASDYIYKWDYTYYGSDNYLLLTYTEDANGWVDSINNSGNVLSRKQLKIGNWDMDGTNSVDVAHGLADKDKIMNIQLRIRNDADSQWLDGGYTTSVGTIGAAVAWDDTNVTCTRAAGGTFDSASYDSVGGFNRGYIIIEYASKALIA